MGYKYLKSTIKTDEALKSKNILIILSSIKIISRCLKFDLISFFVMKHIFKVGIII